VVQVPFLSLKKRISLESRISPEESIFLSLQNKAKDLPLDVRCMLIQRCLKEAVFIVKKPYVKNGISNYHKKWRLEGIFSEKLSRVERNPFPDNASTCFIGILHNY
jgi:hypothetical protein